MYPDTSVRRDTREYCTIVQQKIPQLGFSISHEVQTFAFRTFFRPIKLIAFMISILSQWALLPERKFHMQKLILLWDIPIRDIENAKPTSWIGGAMRTHSCTKFSMPSKSSMVHAVHLYLDSPLQHSCIHAIQLCTHSPLELRHEFRSKLENLDLLLYWCSG